MKLIVAVDSNNGVGLIKDGKHFLPWHYPEDLKNFKKVTMNSVVIMGSTTFDSLNRPNGLPGRLNIVLSKTRKQISDSVVFVDDFQKALQYENGFIIGGASIYEQALRLSCVNELYITRIFGATDANVVSPVDFFNYEHFFDDHFSLKERTIFENFEFLVLKK